MNEKNYAPVILFTYKRLLHTIKTIEALDANVLADKSELFIFSDGYKGDEDETAVKEVRSYLEQYKNDSNFKSVTVYYAENNHGLANSVIDGVTKIINTYGNVIVVEDDLVTSIDFLKFMNEALEYYEKDEKVWSIAGYTPNIRGLDHYNKDVYICLRAGSWGWATWRNRWNCIDWDVKDYPIFQKDKKARKAFGKRGANMPEMLDAQMRGEVDSWAIRFCYEQFKRNAVTINPTISRVRNMGIDGSGTHGVNENKWDVICNQQICEVEFMPVTYNKTLINSYYEFFVGTKRERVCLWIKKMGGNILKRVKKYF